jgi:protein-S-isoprenylcysteine O-methyltransferase Ste14
MIAIMENPKLRLWVWLVVSFILIALTLFLSAGTLNYWQAWVYLGVGAVSNIPLTHYIMSDPTLLEGRTKAGFSAERRPFQKIIVLCLGLPGIAAFVVPGLDQRFGWSKMPAWLSLAGNLLILLGMWVAYQVFKENSFASATIEIRKDQKVISSGPYAVVRNPMYSAAAMYFVGMSLALGSYWGLIPSILTIVGLAVRLLDEEQFLAKNLPGYTEYCARVRSHLIPGIF